MFTAIGLLFLVSDANHSDSRAYCFNIKPLKNFFYSDTLSKYQALHASGGRSTSGSKLCISIQMYNSFKGESGAKIELTI
jgi:hypothetical protein